MAKNWGLRRFLKSTELKPEIYVSGRENWQGGFKWGGVLGGVLTFVFRDVTRVNGEERDFEVLK